MKQPLLPQLKVGQRLLYQFNGDFQVSFQWKNPDFLFKNPDFLLKNPDFALRDPGFLLNNVDFIIKQSAWRWSVSVVDGAHSNESTVAGGVRPSHFPSVSFHFPSISSTFTQFYSTFDLPYQVSKAVGGTLTVTFPLVAPAVALVRADRLP